jgi:hypothetical protein
LTILKTIGLRSTNYWLFRRWWLPGSAVSYETLTAQLESVRNAGFGGVEVAFLGNGGGKPGLRDLDKWGDKEGKWKRMVEFIWEECEK